MPSLQTIRRLTIEGRTTGVNEATAALTALGRAQTTVAQTADGMAVSTDNSAKRQLSAAKQYDNLRARVDDAYRSQLQFQKSQSIVQRAFDQGSIGAEEHARTMAMVAQKYGVASEAANENTKQNGLARHELINLSRQAQDVAVSLAGGQSPLTVLMQQGSQIGDVFATSQGTVGGFFKQVTSSVTGFLTVGRVAFGGVALAITGATMALNDYLNSQQKVQMSLLGAGRASGQSVSSINSIAQSGSSLTGFSITEARAFAAELASMGKIGRDNLEPLVKVGHDIATVYGIDAVAAAQLLGKAFSDPVAGAEELNQRLGFLDAAMQRQIQNLVAQNRLQEAQRILQTGVISGLEGVSDAVSTSTKFWTALGNIASNVWDKIGQAASRATGIGLKLGLDEQYVQAKARLEELQKIAATRSPAANIGLGTTRLIDEQKSKLDELTAAMDRFSKSATNAEQRQMSFAQAGAVRGQQPEIDQLQKLRNEQELLVKTMIDVQTSGGPASEVLKRMGMSYEELARSLSIANTNLGTFKNQFQASFDQAKIAGDALTAFSPSAKGDIARRQSLDSTLGAKMEPAEKKALAEQAYSNAVKGSTVALSEAARARALYGQQTIQSAQLEIDLLGKTVGQQAEMRANLQARQAIEQQASQNRTGFDNAEYERLKKINAEYGQRVQMAAKAALNDNVNFGRQTALLSPEDVSIAQQLKGAYPDVASGLASVEAQGLRTNAALSGLSAQMSGTLTTGFADILDGTKSLSQGMADMSKTFIRNLEEMLIKTMIIAPIMRSLQSAFTGFGFSSGGFVPGSPSGYADGGYTGPGARLQPAGIVHAGEFVFSAAAVNRIGIGNLDVMHRAGVRGYEPGGYVTPANVMPMRSAANGNASIKNEVHIHGATNPQDVKTVQTDDGRGGLRTDVWLDGGIAKALSQPGSQSRKAMGASYGARPTTVRRG